MSIKEGHAHLTDLSLRAARGTANVKIPTMGKEAAWSHNDLAPRKPHFSRSLRTSEPVSRPAPHSLRQGKHRLLHSRGV